MPWCSEILSSALGKEHFFNSLQTNQGCDAEILRTLGDYTAPPWCDAFNLSETLDPAETSCCMMFVRSQNWYRGYGYIDLGVWPATMIGVHLTTIRNATRLATFVTHLWLGISWNGGPFLEWRVSSLFHQLAFGQRLCEKQPAGFTLGNGWSPK